MRQSRAFSWRIIPKAFRIKTPLESWNYQYIRWIEIPFHHGSRNGNIQVWRVSMITPVVADHPSAPKKKKSLHNTIAKKSPVV
jgi:hypothetical protein